MLKNIVYPFFLEAKGTGKVSSNDDGLLNAKTDDIFYLL